MNQAIVYWSSTGNTESIANKIQKDLDHSLMNLSKASNKNIALFGSFGWGDGEWMRNWKEEVMNSNCNLLTDGLIVNGDSSQLGDQEYESFIKNLK